jgi:hypothetical protein
MGLRPAQGSCFGARRSPRRLAPAFVFVVRWIRAHHAVPFPRRSSQITRDPEPDPQPRTRPRTGSSGRPRWSAPHAPAGAGRQDRLAVEAERRVFVADRPGVDGDTCDPEGDADHEIEDVARIPTRIRRTPWAGRAVLPMWRRAPAETTVVCDSTLFRSERERGTMTVIEILRRRAEQRHPRGQPVPPALSATIAEADRHSHRPSAGHDRELR